MKNVKTKPITLVLIALLMAGLWGCEKKEVAIEGQTYCVKAEFIAKDINSSAKYLFDIKNSTVVLGKKVKKDFFKQIKELEAIGTLEKAIIVQDSINFKFEKGKIYYLELKKILPVGFILPPSPPVQEADLISGYGHLMLSNILENSKIIEIKKNDCSN